MTTINIEMKNLRAVALAMAVKDIRYYLCGVLVEYNGAETRLVATDGHRLHAVIVENSGIVTEPVSFIMPSDFVKACLKVKAPRHDKAPVIVLNYFAGKIEARLPDGMSFSGMALDGRFPDYTRVCPIASETGIEAAHYKPEYILDAYRALKDYTQAKDYPAIGMRQKGNSCGYVTHDGFTALIMPMRVDTCGGPDYRLTKPIEAPAKLQSAMDYLTKTSQAEETEGEALAA